MFNSFYKGKKVLITGASGFKGSWMAIWLQHLGAEVFGYSLAPKTEKDNFVACGLDQKINHRTADIRDLDKLKSFIQKVKPEIVFHLAAQPIVLESYQNPVDNFATNVMGTVNLLEAIRHTDSVNIVVNVTTDKVYKNIEQIWGYRENDELAGKDPYSASKSCSELVTSSYSYSFFQDRDIRIATARAGNVIGGGDWAENRIVPDFYRALTAKASLVLRNPAATRPWQHVLESIAGYLELATSLGNSPEFQGAWNFGPDNNNSAFSVGNLVEALAAHNPIIDIIKEQRIQKEKEAILLTLDNTKSRTNLNWAPLLSFEDTVLFTHLGYLADLESSGTYKKRIAQILSYQEKVVSFQK